MSNFKLRTRIANWLEKHGDLIFINEKSNEYVGVRIVKVKWRGIVYRIVWVDDAASLIEKTTETATTLRDLLTDMLGDYLDSKAISKLTAFGKETYESYYERTYTEKQAKDLFDFVMTDMGDSSTTTESMLEYFSEFRIPVTAETADNIINDVIINRYYGQKNK